jgi:hypothetical protein
VQFIQSPPSSERSRLFCRSSSLLVFSAAACWILGGRPASAPHTPDSRMNFVSRVGSLQIGVGVPLPSCDGTPYAWSPDLCTNTQQESDVERLLTNPSYTPVQIVLVTYVPREVTKTCVLVTSLGTEELNKTFFKVTSLTSSSSARPI